MELIYYADHAERYAHLPPSVQKEYPDEVKLRGGTRIKRVKKYREMTHEDYRKYGVEHIRLAAVDIPLSRAIPKELT